MDKKHIYFVLVILGVAVVLYMWKSDIITIDSRTDSDMQTFVGDGYTLQYPDGWSSKHFPNSFTRFSDCTNEFFDQYTGFMGGPPNDACLLIFVDRGGEGTLAYFSDAPLAPEYQPATLTVTESMVGDNEVRKVFRPGYKAFEQPSNDKTNYYIKNKDDDVFVLGNSDGFGRLDSNEHQAKEVEIMEVMVSTFVFTE